MRLGNPPAPTGVPTGMAAGDPAEPDGATLRFLRSDAALFIGPLPEPALHAHHAIQGCLALEGSLDVELPGGERLVAPAALIAADVAHAVSGDGPVAHFYALPETGVGSRLAARLGGRLAMPLDVDAETRDLATRALRDDRLVPRCLDALLELALRESPHPRALDERVATVVRALREGDADASLAELAGRVDLSPDRLRHLIRAEIGLSLRRYRRWVRLLAALEALERGSDVTGAAHAAGFADAAHLSRAFREAFTFPPSRFLRDSRFVQAPPGEPG